MFEIWFAANYNYKGENKPFANAPTKDKYLKFSRNFFIIIIEKPKTSERKKEKLNIQNFFIDYLLTSFTL